MNENAFLKKRSPYCEHLGIFTDNGGRSFKMKVEDKHMNAQGVAHGGAVFSLADRAFASSVNTPGKMAVAMEMKINYLRPANPGDVLEAASRIIKEGRQTTVCLIEVTRGEEKVAIVLATAFNIRQS
jgi:acyl-CoA thioesterase